jgi:glyoxalase-like protein
MLRLRQIALVAHDLDSAEADLSAVFGLAVCHRDPGVGRFGLHNFLMPVGNSFLEVVAPTEDNTAAGRYLDRRDGNGGYMVIMQTDDVPAARERMTSLGVRLIADGGNEHTDGIQLHPADVPATIAELRWNEGDADPAGPWHPAGPDWRPAQRLDVIRSFRAAELQSDDPAALAARWSEVLAHPVTTSDDGHPTIALDDATLRFVPITDGRPEGLASLAVEVVDRDRLLATAAARGCTIEGDTVTVCGTRFHLV